jgi:hypothetical protein
MLLGDARRGRLHAALNASCTRAAEAHRLRTMLPLVPLWIGRPRLARAPMPSVIRRAGAA